VVGENYCWRSSSDEPQRCVKEIVVKQNILLLLFCILLSSCVAKGPNNSGVRQQDKERNEIKGAAEAGVEV
jgi:hypothetical protein